jgi:hypothetical protein
MGAAASVIPLPGTKFPDEKDVPPSVRDQVTKNLTLLKTDKVLATKNLYNLCYDADCKDYMGYQSLGVINLLPLAIKDDNGKLHFHL